MGSYALSFALEPIRRDVESLPELCERVATFLTQTFEDELPPAFRRHACGWVGTRDDSLLTVQPHPFGELELFFTFYDSVTWPIGLAEHWTVLALAEARMSFEQVLHDAGYRVPQLPSLLERLHTSDARYFVSADRIGRTTAIGEEVRWVIDGDESYEIPPTPWSELDAQAREAATAVIESRRCHCPRCLRANTLATRQTV